MSEVSLQAKWRLRGHRSFAGACGLPGSLVYGYAGDSKKERANMF